MSTRDDIARFFHPERWRTPLGEFKLSGYALVDEVNALAPRFVVDVGCGYNLFKGEIDNLIGIDLVNPAADLVCDLEEAPIRPHSIDVVLALASVNYGDQALVERQLRCLASWLTPEGHLFMRANPGMATAPGLDFFPWSAGNVDTIGAAAGLRRDGPIRYDTYTNRNGQNEPRLVWRYRPAPA
ncbi:class I SAM-dependent methyltransferase [Spirillospora sp. NPDC047279]|uniref:class I SAM-dependent methyltransferase n=1 Tax=Spirillospora sp. NPDC047279 TaxID=3155478 RepID=UPI0033FA3B15